MQTAALALAALGAVAFVVMVVKDQTYVGSPAYAPRGEPSREVAVVYHSRSGHSEAVAREVARLFNAPIARLDAAGYSLDFSGQLKAASDAEARALPEITVAPIDLAPVQRVYLVSPTWLFRPTPPLWAFVERSDLSGKEVVLIMTGNSRYTQDHIDAFAERVAARGGRLVRHVFLRRGRVFWQLSREELLMEARARVGGGGG